MFAEEYPVKWQMALDPTIATGTPGGHYMWKMSGSKKRKHENSFVLENRNKKASRPL